MSRRRPHVVRPASLALAVGLLAASLVGCSGDDSGPPDTGPSSSAGAGPPPEPRQSAATVTSINRVDGDLAAGSRDQLQQRVQVAVDVWIDNAYGGTYPREDFSDAFASFTEGARARAFEDDELLSYTAIGSRLDAVLPTRRRVRLDVLGVDGRAVAVTALVDLRLELSGAVDRTDRVTGSLQLTFDRSRDSSGWQIFGYDLQRREV